MTYYKVLRTNRGSWYDESFIWPLHKPVTVENPDTCKDPCGRGLHLAKSLDNAFGYAGMPARCFTVKPLSPVLGEGCDKIRVASAQLVKEITPPGVLRANSFIRSIPKMRLFTTHRPPRKNWRLYASRRNAVRAARNAFTWKRDNMWAGARAVIGGAGREEGLQSMAEEARRAVFSAVWNAPGGGQFDRQADAGLFARALMCAHPEDIKKHIAHARARWDVWQRGYGLYCDLGGELFVYRKP